MSAPRTLLTWLFLATGLVAQAHLNWLPGEQANGTIGAAKCSVWWDPDGGGPLNERLVLGGYFTIPSVGAEYLAWFEPATGRWGAFDAQPDQSVDALTVLSTGELVIAGRFTRIGAQPFGGLAIWDGQGWAEPGGSVQLSASISALLPLPNGDLVIGGSFSQIGGLAIANIARWDGNQWHGYAPIAGGISSLTMRANGNLVVGGDFPGKIAEWTGQAWSLYLPTIGATPGALLAMSNGDIIATGGAARVTRYSGAGPTPTPIGAALSFTIGGASSLLEMPNGDLLAAHFSQVLGAPVNGVARWDGTQWSSYAPNLVASSMSFAPNGDLFATGSRPYGAPASSVAGVGRWDGATWQPLAVGFNNNVNGLLAESTGGVIALGEFDHAPGGDAWRMARFDGQVWSELVPPAAWSAYSEPVCGTVDQNGDAWIAFDVSGGPGPANIFKWSAASWQGVGSAMTSMSALLVEDGVPIVGRSIYPQSNNFSIASWVGSQWLPIGQGLDGPVHALLRRSNGDLIAGGQFLFSGTTSVSRIARFDGTDWLPLGAGFDGPVRALAELPNGDLIAAGDFITDGTLLSPLNLVSRWDGSQWHILDQGLAGAPGVSVRAIQVLPDGGLVVAGNFETANGVATPGVARWDGAVWSAVDGGIDGDVFALAQRRDGELFVGGSFAAAGSESSAHLARLATNSPATAIAVGVGCNTSAGLLQLTATQMPWLGGTYRAESSPVATNALGVDLYGTATTQQPLSLLLPVAGVGCDLLVSPSYTALLSPSNGVMQSAFVIPAGTALLGAQFAHQMLVFELSPSLAITLLAGSNALTATVGVF